jgi:uncharacterized repeat protein (TIGR03806 family)
MIPRCTAQKPIHLRSFLLLALFATLVISGTSNGQEDVVATGVGIEPAFPALRFNRPVQLTHAGDGSDRIFVVEQAGVVRVFENATDTRTSQVFLDISDRISRVGNEEGLLGLAFHPDYKTNGRFFVHYSSKIKDMHAVVAAFDVSQSDPNVADPKSEQILLEQKQPYRNHNGGAIEFGPDGYLYISFGDGGKANDPHLHGQNLKTLLGSILRIDVDSKSDGKNYGIPQDNPFAGEKYKAVDARPEIWAFGLRNVWRFSFDRKTGELWAADVGQNKLEEVNLISRGGNYGWNRFEANSDFREDTKLATNTAQPPVAHYSHQWGLSITGGYVYRGNQFPQLAGLYFYADYVSGNLWSLRKTEGGDYDSQLVRRTGKSVSSFGQDENGELFLCSFDGSIYRVVPSDEPENAFKDWPQLLSKAGIFKSITKQIVTDQFHSYQVNAPFWSDNALKERYFSLPEGKALGYRSDGTWEVPIGAKLVKHFRHPSNRKPIETRLIVRTETGWEAATYVWNKQSNDAELVPEGKQFEVRHPIKSPAGRKPKWAPITWHAPSASECSSCHTDAAGYVLGLNTAQLNCSVGGKAGDAEGQNQIEVWAKLGLVANLDFDQKTAAKYCSPFDESQDLATRARVLLDVNCAMCHRPNGPGNANIDLRFATQLEKTGTLDQPPAQTDLGIAGGKIIAPGKPAQSLLLHRMKTLGQGRMPTIGSNMVDQKAVELLSEWIGELE